MNKSIPYSPFNRTYRYMFLQNQRAHHKNKRQIKSHTKTNLSLSKTDIFNLKSQTAQKKKRTLRCRTSMSKQSDCLSQNESFMDEQGSRVIVGSVAKLPIKIHKNSKIEKFRNYQIDMENSRLSQILSTVQCEIKPYEKTERQYNKSLMYRNIAMKYDQVLRKNKEILHHRLPNKAGATICSQKHRISGSHGKYGKIYMSSTSEQPWEYGRTFPHKNQ